ncbi:MAG: hypothetical protein WCT14_03575 [Treponemataceae bacterium]
MSDSEVPRLILVTGSPGSGKTSAVKIALEQLAAAGFRARAILSEATERVNEGYALGFDALFYEIENAKPSEPSRVPHRLQLEPVLRIPLARRPPPEDGPGTLKERMKPFTFSLEAFASAQTFFSENADSLDMIALDEIGPLELNDTLGYSPVLEAWKAGTSARILLATVRPSLAEKLARRLTQTGGRTGTEISTVTLDGRSIPGAAKEIAVLLGF